MQRFRGGRTRRPEEQQEDLCNSGVASETLGENEIEGLGRSHVLQATESHFNFVLHEMGSH